jgi:DNA-binding IclR family transcriptional regulator
VSSAQKILETLALFTPKQPTWTPERAAKALGISRASAYRYFSLLSQTGFIEHVSGRGYALGPVIIEFDRQIRLSDPLVQSSVDIMVNLAKTTGGAILLCRLYKGRVLCVHQERGARVPAFVSYERGRPMPLYRGATSKAILAFLTPRALNALIERDRAEIARAGLPTDAAALKHVLAPVREKRLCITKGEIDPGVCGAAVPVFEHSRVIGSLSVVLPSSALENGALQRAVRLLARAGHRIEAELDGTKPKGATGNPSQ